MMNFVKPFVRFKCFVVAQANLLLKQVYRRKVVFHSIEEAQDG